MRNRVVFYSLSGKTRGVAEKAARALGAEITEIRTTAYGHGFFRYLRAGLDSWRGALPAITTTGQESSPDEFTLVLGPVWAGSAATPVRAFLQKNKGKLKRVAFVLTCGGSCPPSAFEEMARLAGIKPEQTFTLVEKETRAAADLPEAVTRYLKSLAIPVAA